MNQEPDNPRAIIVGVGSGTRISKELRERLKELGVSVVEMTDSDLRAMSVDIETERLARVRQLGHLLEPVICAPEKVDLTNPYLYDPGLAHEGAAFRNPDRPAWVSPYGPARRRK